jgi:TP901 family phage tail tape measure protein
MAQIGELLIALQGDSKSWSSTMKTAGQDLRTLVKESQKAGQELNDFNAKTVNLLKGWKNEIGDAYRSLEKSLDPVKKGLVEQGKALSVNQKGINKLALEAVVGAEKMKTLNDSLKTTSNSLWLMNRGLQQFGISMTTAFTVPILAAGALSVKQFAEWEQGTLSIQRAAEITRTEAENITESFVKISQQVPLTVEELQKAGYAAAQAGVTGEESITNFAKAATMLSKVGGDAFKDLPVEDLANKLAYLGIAFGETGENWSNVNNLASTLLVVAKAVPGGLSEIIEAMRRASGAASTFGLSLSDTTAAMGTLVAAGVPASRAGTEFQSVLLDMATNADKVAQSLGYTNENMNEFKERMETDMLGVLDELIQRYGLVDGKIDETQHLQEIFGKTSLKALLPLIENVDLFHDLQARANGEMENGALLAAEFAVEANSLSGTFSVFKNNVDALKKAIGDDLAPYVNLFLKSVTTGLQSVVAWWEKLNPTIKVAIVAFAALLALIGPLALLLNTLFISPIFSLSRLLSGLVGLVIELGATASAGTVASVSMSGLSGAFVAATGAVASLIKGIAILALQLGTIVAIIGVAIAAVYLLGKAFGIGFKLPKMPEIKLPKSKGTGAGAITDLGGQEKLAQVDEDAAKEREKALKKEMKEKKKARDKELKIIDKNIKDFQKVSDREIKARQKLVDEQEQALYDRREQWEDEQRLEQEKIRMQEETLETAKETLKKAKKELNALEDAQDEQVDLAEDKVDYAEMNLKAAQDALKREKLLGKDEFDASYRAALERVEAWEAATQLARENVIAVKKEYQKQINAQEEIVDANEEQVDLQTSALDDLKDALKERKAVVDKEIDVLQDELKIRQDALSDYKSSADEKLDLLREEKSARQEAWDEELAILQDQLDAARDFADELSNSGISELPKATQGAIDSFEALDAEFQKQIEEMQTDIKKAMSFGPEIKEGGLIADYKNAWEGAKELAETEGKSAGQIYVEAMWASLVDTVSSTVDEIFGQLVFGDNMDEARKMAKEEGKSFSQLIWEGVKEWWEREVKEKFSKWINEKIIDPIKDILPNVKQKGKDIIGNVAQGIWEGLIWIKDAVTAIGTWPLDGIKNIISIAKQFGREIIGNISQGIWDGLDWVKTAINTIGGWPMNEIRNIINNAKNWGKDMIGNFAQGIWDGMNWVKDAVKNMANWLKGILHFSEPDFGPLKGMNDWGKDMIKTYIDGIKSEIPNLEDTLNKISVNKNLENINGNVGNSFTGMASNSIAEGKVAPAIAQSTSTVNKNYYIQPGQMIATRGEVRSFVRLLKEYDKFEEER